MLGLVLGLALLAAPAATAAAPLIEAVEIRLDAPLGRPLDLATLLAFAPGDRLEDDAVRRTLSNLHASGLVAEAEILSRAVNGAPGKDGVVAIVVIHAHTWVETVELAGDLALPRRTLERSVEQQAGAPLLEDRLLRSVYALQDRYREAGYLEATVRLEVSSRPQGKRVDVRFQLASGRRAVVGAVDFAGSPAPFTTDALRSALELATEAPYSDQVGRRAADRLRAWLAEQGHLAARVEAPSTDYDASSGRVAVTFPLNVGPPIVVQVRGADRQRLRKKGLLPFLEDEVFDEALLDQTCDRLRTDLQRRGHYRAQVDCEVTSPENGPLLARIAVDAGPVYTLTALHFTGNERFPATQLRDLMRTAPRRFGRGGRLVDEELDADVDNLRSFYALQGFAQAVVEPPVVSVDGTELSLEMTVREGSRRRLVEIAFAGVSTLDAAALQALRNALPLKSGGPYHPVLLDESELLIRARYEELGYAETLVEPALDWNGDRTLVDVLFNIEEGTSTRIDRILLRGHRHTESALIRSSMQLQPGDPLSRRALLEAERQLYRLGIFSRVDVEAGPRHGEEGWRDVIITLEEGRRWRLGYGVSYHSEDGPGGLLSVSRINLRGRAQRLQLDLRANEREQRFRLLLDQPTLGPFRLPLTYGIFRRREERQPFTLDELGAQVALTKDLANLRLGLAADYRLVELSSLPADLGSLERDEREVRITSLTPTLFLDRRDDPVSPRRGWSTALQVEHALPVLGTEAEFLKLFGQQTQYLSVGSWGTFASSFRLGLIEPLDDEIEPDPLVPAGLESALVPASERFFAGGRSSHRAYRRDRLGIPGETLRRTASGDLVELGGNGLLLINLDYRFPISGPVGGTVFVDLGNVWADWRRIDLEALKTGVGLGVRYSSPIGPVRLEIGWKLDLEPGERNPVFLLSFGNPF